MKNNKYRNSFLVCLAIIAFVSVLYFNREKPVQRDEGMVWATQYHITYKASNSLSDSIQGVFTRLDNSISPFNKNSLITKINDNASTEVDEYFTTLYNASRSISKASNGAFDPTVSPLINAWGFGYKSGVLPDSTKVDSLLKIVGITKTSIKNNNLIKSDPRISFNFSAIAKGMGSDEVGKMLERNGVEDYMVEIGGEIALKGLNDKGEKWRISIDMPQESNDSVIHESALVIAVTDCGIATSGNYRNYKIVNGHKLVHTINPISGYPEMTNLLSVTIIAPNCMLADAYATTCMVLGTEKGKEFITAQPGVSATFITSNADGSITRWETPNFSQMVVK